MNLMRDIFSETPKFAVLIDPDHESDARFDKLLDQIAHGYVDVILVGGSTSQARNMDRVISKLRAVTDKPILIFPGNAIQLSEHADGLLLPSLISGRNAEYLIGRHVESAMIIHNSGIPVFSMGYMLVDGGSLSTTSYMTQTLPIPYDKPCIAAQTALAGQLLGMKCLYLESGSGASKPANAKMITTVKKTINIPLIVGGGITHIEDLVNATSAGADMVVVGTFLEQYPEHLMSFYEAFKSHISV